MSLAGCHVACGSTSASASASLSASVSASTSASASASTSPLHHSSCPHNVPSPSLILLPRNLHLLSSQGTRCCLLSAGDSHATLVFRLVVVKPLVVVASPFILLMLRWCFPSSWPLVFLFASWLSHHPCCRATLYLLFAEWLLRPPPASAVTLPLPLILLMRCLWLCLAMLRRHLCAGAPPPVCLSFASWLSNCIFNTSGNAATSYLHQLVAVMPVPTSPLLRTSSHWQNNKKCCKGCGEGGYVTSPIFPNLIWQIQTLSRMRSMPCLLLLGLQRP